MTRTRKVTLSMKEFSHLVSESLDIANPPLAQSFVNIPVVSENTPKPRPSSFQRIFARPPLSPGHYEDSSAEKPPDDGTETSRKMIVWPFSRSPRKNRTVRDDSEDARTHVEPELKDNSMDSIMSLAAASTSSLGSLLPAHERLFQVMSRDGFFSDESCSNQNSHSVRAGASSPLMFPEPRSPPAGSASYGTRTRVQGMVSNQSAVSVIVVTDDSTNEPQPEIWCQRRLTRSSGKSTATSNRDSLSVGETDSSDDDPTPRASTFGSQTKLPRTVNENESSKRSELEDRSIVMPPSSTNAVVYESPATTPATSRPQTPSLTSPAPQSLARVAFPHGQNSSPPRSQTPSDLNPPPKAVTVCPTGSPRQRPRSLSRTMVLPPLPRPPPTGPLPAVPSFVPPVPPLPPLLSKKSTMKMSPPLPISSRSCSPSSAPLGMTVGTPPSPPGGLRLPSRLSWVNTVRAVLPSPPASPRLSKDRSSPSVSPSREKIKSGSLKRPTSISVIEAADNGRARRAKSILLLTSRSKSHASLGATKRVQIHAEANTDPGPSRKLRRKSSAAAVGQPDSPSSASEVIFTSGGAELLVPRERRHSAPLLSSASGSGTNAAQACADWTLSLPFSIDAPGNQICTTSPSAGGKSEEEPPAEDWTLCMPLKVRLAPTVVASEGGSSEFAIAETTKATENQHENQMQTQLPTPSPSPIPPSSPASLYRLELEDPEQRPASPASLGPHAGGLDMDGGRGKRASGWHVYGWFDEVEIQDEVRIPLQLHMKENKNHVATFRKTSHEPCGRNMSQDSTSTLSTNGGTVYHSARSSLLVE